MPTIYNHDIPSLDIAIYDDTTHPYIVSNGSIGPSITATSYSKDKDVMKRLVENYLQEYYHGITLDEVLELIRNHQPERLL